MTDCLMGRRAGGRKFGVGVTSGWWPRAAAVVVDPPVGLTGNCRRSRAVDGQEVERGRMRVETGGPRPGRVHVGRWAGGQHLLPSTLSELREGGFGLVSCLPSGEGGCGYSPGRFWTTVRASSMAPTSRSTRLALSRQVCPLPLGIATPALVEAVTGLQYNSSPGRHGAPILHIGLFPSSATHGQTQY